MLYKFCLILAMILLMISTTNASYVYLNGSAVFIRTPYLHRTSSKPPFNVTSFLLPLSANASGLQDCKKADPTLAPYMKGAIVFVAPDGGCSINQHALVAQNAGAAGVIVITYASHLFAANIQRSPNVKLLTVPVIFMEVPDFTKYVVPELSKGLAILKIEGDKSDLDLLNKGGMIFYVILLTLINLCGLGLMVYQIIRFLQLNGPKISVALVVFATNALSCIFGLLFLFDPLSYWHAIANYDYLVIVTNFPDYFFTLALLLVSFHLSRVVLKTTHYIKYVWIPYSFAIFLMVGYTAVLIVSVHFNLSYDTGKLSVNGIEKFRISVFSLIAAYLVACTLYFVMKLYSMWAISNEQKQTKRIKYKRLVLSTFGIWFVSIVSLIVRCILLDNKYAYGAKSMIALIGVGVCIGPGYAVCYFFLFQSKNNPKKSGSTNAVNSEEGYKKFSH